MKLNLKPHWRRYLRCLGYSLFFISFTSSLPRLHLNAWTSFLNPSKYYNTKGNQAFQNEDYQNAITFYQKASEHAPENVEILNNLATAFHHIGQYTQAEKLYRSAIDLQTAQNATSSLLKSQLHYNLGTHYLERNHYPQAISAYKAALKANHKDFQAKKNLELALGRSLIEEKKETDSSYLENEQSAQPRNEDSPSSQSTQPSPQTGKERNPTAPLNKSSSPLEQGQEALLNPAQPETLPSQPQNKQSQQTNQDQKEYLSRKRATEILENFEERHSKFQKLTTHSPPQGNSRPAKNW